MKRFLFALAFLGFIFMDSEANTTARTTTTTRPGTTKTTARPMTTTKQTLTTTAKPQTTTPTTKQQMSTTMRTQSTTTSKKATATTTRTTTVAPFAADFDTDVEMALDLIMAVLFNYFESSDLPHTDYTTTLDELAYCITPKQKYEFNKAMKTCKDQNRTDITVCFLDTLVVNNKTRKIDMNNMMYIVQGTNLTSSQKTSATTRMQKCFDGEGNVTILMFWVLDLFLDDNISKLLEPILQDLFNGRDLDCRKNEETTKTKETLHVIKAMLCIFEGLETNGCSNINNHDSKSNNSAG